jgi:hypothetical protein
MRALRGTSLIRNCFLLGPYSKPMPRAPWWSYGKGQFLMSKVPLYGEGPTVVLEGRAAPEEPGTPAHHTTSFSLLQGLLKIKGTDRP